MDDFKFDPEAFYSRMFGSSAGASAPVSSVGSLASFGNYGPDGPGLRTGPLTATPPATTLSEALGSWGSGAALASAGSKPAFTPTAMQEFLGYTDPSSGYRSSGWGNTALGGAAALGNLYMGMKNYGLAKDSLALQKDQYAKNYAANMKLTNAQLADRQARRVQENPNAMGVSEYMGKYGLV